MIQIIEFFFSNYINKDTLFGSRQLKMLILDVLPRYKEWGGGGGGGGACEVYMRLFIKNKLTRIDFGRLGCQI